jgi:hypothetical protein
VKKLFYISFILVLTSLVAFATGDTELGQNYPNPAKEKTYVNVEFTSPQARLTISNVLGKTLEIKTLTATGTFVLDVTNYPEGVYFYTLEADGQKLTKKMTVKK